jgi:hypothetical protein
MNYVCENCDHINTIEHEPASLDIRSVLDWQNILPPDQVASLSAEKFVDTQGTLADGRKFTTLYLSKLNRRPMMTEALGHPTTLLEDIRQTFTGHVVPVIDQVCKNFNVLGTLALPCVIKLAVVDLTCPVAVFTFITVEKTPDFKKKLKDLGLQTLLNEGSVETIDIPAGTTGRGLFH